MAERLSATAEHLSAMVEPPVVHSLAPEGRLYRLED
jgi:hypothetical protein